MKILLLIAYLTTGIAILPVAIVLINYMIRMVNKGKNLANWGELSIELQRLDLSSPIVLTLLVIIWPGTFFIIMYIIYTAERKTA